MTPLTTARLREMIEAAEQADTQFIAQCANHGTAVYLSHLDPQTIIALCKIALAAKGACDHWPEIAAYSDDPDTQNNQLHRAIAAIDAALAEPDPQPVAWKAPNSRKVISHDDREYMLSMRKVGGEFQSAAWLAESYSIPLYAAPVVDSAQISDSLREFVEDMAEADCHYGDGCTESAMRQRRHGRCDSCKARAVLAAGRK